MFTETLPSGRVRAGFRVKTGGKFRKVTRTFDYEFEAVAWAEEAERRAVAASALGAQLGGDAPAAADVVPGVPGGAPAPTVKAYGEVWIEARAGVLVKTTVDGYRTHLNAIGADPIAAITLDQITAADVESWLTRQRRAGVGAATINARLKVLRMLSRYAVRNRIPGAYDATDGVGFVTAEVRPGRVISKVEEARLLLAAHTPEATAQILLGLDAGLRWEEALAVPVDVLVGGVTGEEFVDVRQVVERGRTVRGYTKGKKSRPVPVTDRLLAALRPLVEKAEAEGRALVFSTLDEDGVERPVDYHNWRRDVWRRITHAAKVNRRADAKPVAGISSGRLRFHDLRHTYGSRLAAAGVPRSEIAEVMGHADEKTTARYIHAGTDGRRRDLVLAALSVDTGEAVGADLRPVAATAG